MTYGNGGFKPVRPASDHKSGQGSDFNRIVGRDAAKARIASNLYVHNDWPVAGCGSVLLPGDYLLKMGMLEDGRHEFLSSRGRVLYLSQEDFADALEAGDMAQAFPESCSDAELAEAIGKCREQGEYRDAEAYRALPDGSKAVAMLRIKPVAGRRTGFVSVERDGDAFWSHTGVTGPFRDSDAAGYEKFNPKGGPVFPVDEWTHYIQEQERAEAARPMARLKAMLTGKQQAEVTPKTVPRNASSEIRQRLANVGLGEDLVPSPMAALESMLGTGPSPEGPAGPEY